MRATMQRAVNATNVIIAVDITGSMRAKDANYDNKANIERIDAAEHGNFGDCEPVGEGVSEMRIHFGPGYRAYFTRRGEVVYLLLLGGDKSSQKRDIRRAIQIARTLDKE